MDVGPVEILYNWQSVLLAVGVYATTTSIKHGLNLAFGSESRRKANKWITEVLLPVLPLMLGAIGAIVVPLHPDKLSEYIATHTQVKPWMVCGAWGAAVGQFADYLYQRANSAMAALTKPPAAELPAPAVAPAAPVAEPPVLEAPGQPTGSSSDKN